MKRYDCLKVLASEVSDEALTVVTIGGMRHEWHHLRPSPANFYMNNMGGSASVGLGLALALPHRKIVVVDGDGALLLNLGILATISMHAPPNLVHMVFDNQVYDSVARVPTATAGKVDLAGMARSAGIEHSYLVHDLEGFKERCHQALNTNANSFVCAKVEPGTADVPDLPVDHIEVKLRFVRYLEKTENLKIHGLPPLD